MASTQEAGAVVRDAWRRREINRIARRANKPLTSRALTFRRGDRGENRAVARAGARRRPARARALGGSARKRRIVLDLAERALVRQRHLHARIEDAQRDRTRL